MVAWTFYGCRKVINHPAYVKQFFRPNTLGEHIKKKRLENGQIQKDVAGIIGVTEDCLTYWENNRNQPMVKHYPAIINYLGYYPFDHETETLAGKLKQIRYVNGDSFKRFADNLKYLLMQLNGGNVVNQF